MVLRQLMPADLKGSSDMIVGYLFYPQENRAKILSPY